MNLMKYLPKIVRQHPIISIVVAVVAVPPVVRFVKAKIDELRG